MIFVSYRLLYSNTPKMIFDILTVFLVGRCNFVMSAQSCSQRFTNRPMQGYNCIGGYLVNLMETPQNRCTNKCILDSQCRVLSYNTVHHYCLLSMEPCVVADEHPDFMLMVFRLSETEQCVSWETGNIPIRMVESPPQHSTQDVVWRVRIVHDLHPGIGFPKINGRCHFTKPFLDLGLTMKFCLKFGLCAGLMPYTPGNILPTSAVRTGYITAVGHTYTAQIYSSGLNSVKLGVYIPGDNAAHYPHIGDKSSAIFDILVQVWYGTDSIGNAAME